MENAKFIISLDFELKWGVFDALDEKYDKNLLGVRDAIPKILELFKQYDIHATWATVGMLFNQSKEDFELYKPKHLPSYNNSNLNPYINNVIGKNEKEDKLYYGHELIKLVQSYENQEIASHAYSHYNALACGQTIVEFEDDVKSAIKIAKDKFNIDLRSYVFAKNEIKEEYLLVLEKHGFIICRSNPNHTLYNQGQNLNKFQKIIRYADSYINLTGKYNSVLKKEEKISFVQGDRFLRPHKNKIFSFLMKRRIKSEMLYAAKNNKIYHLWWHPHNFGICLEENLTNLKDILKYYKYLNEKYKMESLCMCELVT